MHWPGGPRSDASPITAGGLHPERLSSGGNIEGSERPKRWKFFIAISLKKEVGLTETRLASLAHGDSSAEVTELTPHGTHRPMKPENRPNEQTGASKGVDSLS